MPAGDVSVSAEFTPITDIPADGVISSNGVYSFTPDETGIYKFEFDSYINNLKLLTGTDVFCEGQGSQLTAHLTAGETYYLLTSKNDVNISDTVNVTYSKQSAYTITSSAVENGSVSFLSYSQEITEASDGETVIISLAPDYGCKLKSVTVNKASGDAVTVNTNTSYNWDIGKFQTTYSFTMPAEDVTVSAEFEVDPTILRIGDNNIADTQGQYVNHFFTPTESGKYYFAALGENPNVYFTLLTGDYSYINNGTNAVLGDLEADTEYRLQINTNSSENITVKVKKAETHSITLDTTAEHGAFSAVNTNKEPISGAYEGEKIYVKAEPEEGYSLKRLVVTDAQGNPVEAGTNSFIMPTSDVTVSAVFGEFSAKLDEEGTLHLSGDVTVSDVQSFSKNPTVKKIVADEGTVLPENCRELFYQFGSVTEIDLSSADASNVTNMLDMFSNCSALKKITFGDHFNTANVEVMAFMFFNCSSLTELDLSRFDTSNVRSLYCTFRYCSGLETLDLSSFNTAKLTNLDHTFADCTDLKTVYVSDNWNTDSVTTSNNMFLNCTSLVGGVETAYDSGHVTKEYARIDGGEDEPGYLTYKTAVSEKNPVTSYMNLTIIDGTAIGINFFFEVNEGEPSDYTVNYGGKSTLISDLPTKTVSGKTLPCLSMTAPAKRMTDKMTVTVMKGETEIKKIEKSIVDYSDILLSDANASDYYELIKAMLNYGAAAQTYFGYDTEHLANQNCPLDYTDVTIPAKTFEDKQTMLDILAAEDSPVSYYAMNLTLESETELSIHFNIKDSFTMEQAKAYLATFTVDGSPAVVGEKNGRPVITIKNIPAKTLFKTYSISKGEQSFGVSVDMYMTAVMNGSDENLKALCKALYQFYLAKS